MDQTQKAFFKKHLKRSKYLINSKKINEARQREYEAYLQLKSNVLGAIATLPDSVASQKASLLGEVGAADASVKDMDTLGTAYDDMRGIERKLTAVIEAAKAKAKEATPEGQIMLLLVDAQNKIMREGSATRDKFAAVAKKFEARFGDSSAGQLLEQKAFENDLNAAMSSVRRIVGIDETDVTADKAKIQVAAAKTKIEDAYKTWTTKRLAHESALAELLKNPGQLVETINNSIAQAELNSILLDASEVIADLERWDNTDAATLRREHDRLHKLCKDTSQDFGALQKEGDTLLKDASKIKKLHAKHYFEDAGALKARMDAVLKTAQQIDVKKLKAEQTSQLQQLINQFAATLYTGCNSAMLVPLEGIVSDAEVLLHELQNAEVMNKTVEKNLDKIGKLISSGLGKSAIRQSDRTAHTEALTKLKAEWVSMVPTQANDAILQLTLKVRESIKNEEEQQQWRKDRLAEITELEKELAKLNKEFQAHLKAKGEKKANYQGSMAADLALCKTWTTTKEHRSFESTVETKLAGARAAIATALMRLGGTAQRDVLLGELLTEHKNIEDSKSDAEVARQALLTKISDFETTLKQTLKSIPRLKTHPDDVALIQNTVKQAKDAAKKGGNTENGERLLKAAQDRLDAAVIKPAKLDYGALGEIGKNWEKAYGQLVGKIADLNKAVADLADGTEQEERAKKLAAQLSAASGRMHKDGFKAIATKLGAESTTDGERKANREKALALVRSYRDVLPGDNLMRMCAGGNPFAVKNFGGAVHQCLREIELEVLRGV